MQRWGKMVHNKSVEMTVIPNLQYYHAGNNWLLKGTSHPWGFDYDEIVGRKYLPCLAREAQIDFFDTYQYAYENQVDTTNFYTHPRYAYFSEKGAVFFSEFIVNSVEKHLRSQLNENC